MCSHSQVHRNLCSRVMEVVPLDALTQALEEQLDKSCKKLSAYSEKLSNDLRMWLHESMQEQFAQTSASSTATFHAAIKLPQPVQCRGLEDCPVSRAIRTRES